jgi:parvulin-like peptidyl-prolyl isomerase
MMVKICLMVLLMHTLMAGDVQAQSTSQIRKELESTPDPIGYLKKIKKKYFIDTVTIVNTLSFLGKADSLAYKGKVGKVYGPFPKENILVKILGKAPNTFYHVQHILLDTSIYTKKFADSLATNIISRIKAGTTTFKSMASTYSADAFSSHTGGDLGWFVRGAMLPQVDKELSRHKKGDLFKVWSQGGLHIIKIADNPKQDNGFALVLRVIL